MAVDMIENAPETEQTVYSEGRGAAIVKWGLATIIVAVALFVVVDFLEGPFYSLSTKTWPLELRGDKLIGGIEGPVKAADSGTGTVLVASGFLGLGSLPLVVTPDTKIAVNGKLGGFADLDRGQFVRVAYEVLPDRLLAWRVEVLDRWSEPSEAMVPAETDTGATVDEEKSASESVPKPVAAPTVVPSRAPAQSATTSPPRPTSPVAPPQSSRTTAPATKRPALSPSSSPRTATQDIRRPAPVSPAPVSPAPVSPAPVSPAPANAAPSPEASPPAAPQAQALDDAL